MAKEQEEKVFHKTSINWLKSIFGKNATNPYKSRDL